MRFTARCPAVPSWTQTNRHSRLLPPSPEPSMQARSPRPSKTSTPLPTGTISTSSATDRMMPSHSATATIQSTAVMPSTRRKTQAKPIKRLRISSTAAPAPILLSGMSRSAVRIKYSTTAASKAIASSSATLLPPQSPKPLPARKLSRIPATTSCSLSIRASSLFTALRNKYSSSAPTTALSLTVPTFRAESPSTRKRQLLPSTAARKSQPHCLTP